MNVLVAGATGVLGRALVPRLVACGHSVSGVAADQPAGDLVRLVRGCDAVVHLAVDSRPSAEGARQLLEAALSERVPRYLRQSFVTAYRDGGDRWLDEQAPLADCAPAIELEAIVRAVDPNLIAWTILRGGPLVGAGACEATIEALRDGSLVVAGDGSNYLSPTTAADMASGIVAALERAPAGSTFNLVDEPLRYGDYVDALADLVGAARPRRAAELPLPPSRRCANRAALSALGWLPRERIWPYVDAPHRRAAVV